MVLDRGGGNSEALRTQLLTDVAELLHRAQFDLPDALARYVQFAAHFFKRPRPAVVQSEPKPDDIPLARCQTSEDSIDLFATNQRPSDISGEGMF